MLSHISSHGIKNIEESLPLITNNVSSKIFEDDGANEGNVNNEGHMIRNEKGVNEEVVFIYWFYLHFNGIIILFN